MTYHYKAFGLYISSDIEISELITGKGDPDVRILYGKVPDSIEKPKVEGIRYQAKEGQLLLKVDNIANYLINNGSQIIIEPHPEADTDDIKLFLLGSAFGALIQQRGLLTLHASAIKVNGGCVIFCGASGNGKSTIVGEFVKRGYQLHTDDICVVSTNNKGLPIAFSGYPQFKLWEDALKYIGKDKDSYSKVRKEINKFAIPVRDQFNSKPLPLKNIYILKPNNENKFELSSITGSKKFTVLKNQTFRFKFIEGMNQQANHFKTAASIGKYVPLQRIQRPQHPYLLKELADLLEKDFLD